WPFSAATAARASCPSICNSAKPLHSPLKRSLAMRRPRTLPWFSNKVVSACSVMPRGSPRTVIVSMSAPLKPEMKSAGRNGFRPALGEAFGTSGDLDLIGLQALRALGRHEADLLAFLQRLEAGALDRAEMHEQVVTAFLADEAEALGIVEPFDGSGFTF